MGGRFGRGTVEVRGEEGREVDPVLDLERGRVLAGKGTGVGAWICIDMARVGRARSGTRPRLMESGRGVVEGDDLWAGVPRGESQS